MNKKEVIPTWMKDAPAYNKDKPQAGTVYKPEPTIEQMKGSLCCSDCKSVPGYASHQCVYCSANLCTACINYIGVSNLCSSCYVKANRGDFDVCHEDEIDEDSDDNWGGCGDDCTCNG